MRLRIILLLLLVSAGAVRTGGAATWYVEKDGSGDFTVIQDAVDAAASGDTVRIGPGNYDDGQIVHTAGWDEFVRVLVHQEELTIIGAGPEETVIGPDTPYDYSQNSNRGIEAGPYFGSLRVWISGIGFRNMRFGVSGDPSADFYLSNCRFDDNFAGVYGSDGIHIEIDSCRFFGIAESGLSVYTNSMENFRMTNCLLCPGEPLAVNAIEVQLDGTLNMYVSGCSFEGGNRGLAIWGREGSAAVVFDCRFDGQAIAGLYFGSTSLVADQLVFQNQKMAIGLYWANTNVEITNSSFSDVNECSIKIDDVESLTVRQCDLACGEQYAVIEEPYKETSMDGYPRLDLTNNYWGTTDADSVAARIYMINYEVDYIPFLSQPVLPTASATLGGVKAMFR